MFQDNQPEQTPQPENTQQPTVQEPQETTQEQQIEQPSQANQPVQEQQVKEQTQTQPQEQQKVSTPTAPTQMPEKTTQEERMWAAIGYIAFLGVVTLAMKPKSEFCKHHAAQGLTIFALWFVSLILLAMPSFIGAIGGLLLLGFTVLAIFGIVKAIQSYKLELPIISAIAKKIPTNSIIGSVTGKTPESTTNSQESQQNVQVQKQAEPQNQTPEPQTSQTEQTQNSQDNQSTPPPSNPQV